MQFSTCCRRNALEFIRQGYPSRNVQDEGSVAAMLDLIEADIVRVTDPSMHGTAQIVPGTKWDEEQRESVVAVATKMHNDLTAS